MDTPDIRIARGYVRSFCAQIPAKKFKVPTKCLKNRLIAETLFDLFWRSEIS